MTIDRRGERAGADFRRAIDEWSSSELDPRSFDRFERFRVRQLRNRRIAAVVVGATVTVVSVVLVTRAFGPVGERSASSAAPRGVILYGEGDPVAPLARWHTVRPDGSARRDLDLMATCAVWWPDGSVILTTDDAAAGPGRPLRPALVDPDGSHLRRLDAVDNPDLNLGCGDVSPDGTTIALEGFGQDGHPELDGIYSIDASDGRALKLLLAGPVAPPRYSPDGTQLSFFDERDGVSPTGSGALFVMRADGRDPVRIDPVGVRVRRPCLVARRSMDRVPASLRAAVPRPPGWFRPPSHPARAPAGLGCVESFLVSGRGMDRVQPPTQRPRRDRARSSGWHRFQDRTDRRGRTAEPGLGDVLSAIGSARSAP